MKLKECQRRRWGEEEGVIFRWEATHRREGQSQGLLLGREVLYDILKFGRVEAGAGEESDVRPRFKLDELGADLAPGENIPGLQDLVFKRRIEVELNCVALRH